MLVLVAFKQGRLIGLLRAVGDGYSIVFIQDILVRPEYQRQGIGRALLEQAVNHFPDVYQLHLLTDNSRKTCAFYESLGFTKVSNINCVAYTYLRDTAISGEMFTE